MGYDKKHESEMVGGSIRVTISVEFVLVEFKCKWRGRGKKAGTGRATFCPRHPFQLPSAIVNLHPDGVFVTFYAGSEEATFS